MARPAGSGAVEPVLVQLTPTPRARQWRVFRTVDGGPATLIAEGALPPGAPPGSIPVQAVDDAMPAVAARLCYFGQVADENGNWSPLGPLGCEDVLPAELPVPLLSEPQFDGDASRPVARLKWFCPPDGVNHFRIVMKPVAGDPPDQGLSAVTAPLKTVVASSPRPVSWSTEVELSASKIAAVVSTDYVTGPVGAEPMGPGPEFAYPMDVEAGMTYEVLVVAVDARGQAGHGSRARRFRWRVPVAVVDRDVPWPQRPLPPVKALHPAMTASLLATNPMIWPATSQSNPTGVGVGAGVRIGSFFLGQRELPQDLLGLGIGENGGRLLRLFVTRSAIAAGRGFESFLYGDEMSRPPNRTFRALNVVLYREQVSNAAYPEVSGDVVQVSPLLRRLAYRVLPGGDGYEFLDPMVGLSLHLPAPAAVNQPPPRIDVHLLDLHPVVRGARYRYWVVHFDENGEPDRTIPAGDVEVAP
ncbi:MAG: hypothetical protein JNL97_04760 [Verrucomicrobiales bacterium]|nr:hypothetical protein [Verrucomicrobiales bacterium]